MATRFYLPSSGTAPLASLAADTAWELTTGLVRRPTDVVKTDTALTSTTQAWPSTTTQQWVRYQYQSKPMVSTYNWTTADTVSMVLGKLAETTNSGDTHLAYVVRVVSSDGGTIRGTIGLYHATSTEFPLMASAATRIHSARTNGATNFTSQVGDRIIIELGLHAVTPATENIQMRVGDPNATSDFALTSGLTTDLCPWVELSRTVSFDPQINTTDDAKAQEAIDIVASFPQVSLALDDITLSESKTVSLQDPTPLEPRVTNAVTIGESLITVASIANISHTDGLTVNESLTIDGDVLPIDDTASPEAISLGDVWEVEITEDITSVSDNITLAEALTISTSAAPTTPQVGATDGVVMTDGPRYYTEDVIVYELLSIVTSEPQIDITNDITLGESQVMYLTETGDIFADAGTDNIGVGESSAVMVSEGVLSVSDNVTLGESRTVTNPLPGDFNITITDALTLGETVVMLCASGLQVLDNADIGESVTVSLQAPITFTITQTDGITLGETLTMYLVMVTHFVPLTLFDRSEALTLEDRDKGLHLFDRSVVLTLEDR